MTNRILADRVIESGALFAGTWSLERVGHEQWVMRGTEENLPALFDILGSYAFPGDGKQTIELTTDMKLVIHPTVEHVQLRIYDKERMESLLKRDDRKLVISPESIKSVHEWLKEAFKGGVVQLSYLADTMSIFGEEEEKEGSDE